MKKFLLKLPSSRLFIIFIAISLIFIAIVVTLFQKNTATNKALTTSNTNYAALFKDLEKVKKEYDNLKNTDQIVRNNELEITIKSVQKTFTDSISVYESLTELPASSKELSNYRKQFAKILKYLSDKNYSSGSAALLVLKASVDKEKAALLAASGGIDTTSLTKSTTPPGSGYSRQLVELNGNSFIVDIIAGSLNNTKIIVDTASATDCRDNCPTLSLGNYVGKNGAYAGINGSYFCPAEYPSCVGKTNSFDTLAMNKNKHYFNSDNNVYSTVPAVIFGNGFIRFIGRSLDWGRDAGVDGVLANQPLLLSGGNVTFGGDGDPKKGSVGNRSFIANKGNTAYIGVIRNATVAQAALVLKAMGMENALNLDSGGSTALWANGGYKAGPGRNLPNVILFVNK